MFDGIIDGFDDATLLSVTEATETAQVNEAKDAGAGQVSGADVVEKTVCSGTPAQNVTKLYDKIQDLGEQLEIQCIKERKARREQIKKLLSKAYSELDRLWLQDFEVDSRVLVKFTGETCKPT